MRVTSVMVSAFSAVIVGLVVVGTSTIATFLYRYMSDQQMGDIMTTSRVVWFFIVSVLSFLYILMGLGKGNKGHHDA